MSLLGIDIGTTGCKASVFDPEGRTLASAYREYDVIRTRPGQAELDSREVWDKIDQVIGDCAASAKDITALTATSMGEAMVPVDRNGSLCGNSVLGTDTRGDRYRERFLAAVGRAELYRLTGQPANGGYALPNLARIKAEEPELYRTTAKFLPWADFVTFMLTGEFQANYSLASRTLLFDREKLNWSEPLLQVAGLDADKLPPPIPSGRPLGRIRPSLARQLHLPTAVQIVSGSHDQCAAALGTGGCEPDTAMLGLGTYACMVLVHRRPEPEGPFGRLGLNIEPASVPGQYVSFIYHGSGGALIKWLRREMFRDLPDEKVYERMNEELAAARYPTVVFPYFDETGPLDYASGGQGAIAGLSLAHSRADILKGAMEGVIFYFKDALAQLKHGGCPVGRLQVSGGGAESPFWRQMIADILDVPVVKPQVRECGALGAALTAGVATGVFASYAEATERTVKLVEIRRPESPADYEQDFLSYCRLKSGGLASKLSE